MSIDSKDDTDAPTTLLDKLEELRDLGNCFDGAYIALEKQVGSEDIVRELAGICGGFYEMADNITRLKTVLEKIEAGEGTPYQEKK